MEIKKGLYSSPHSKAVCRAVCLKKGDRRKEVMMLFGKKIEEKTKTELGIKSGSKEDLLWRFHISPRFYQAILAGFHNN
jgi:hypothetical protein